MTRHTTPARVGGVATTDQVTGRPSLSATTIDRILCRASSPACGTGQDLYDGSVSSGIDDAYALAFFEHESSFGLYGIAHDNLGLGNIRCSAGYSCKSGFRAYTSWSQGYADWYKLIAWYISDLHKSSVAQIVTTYAPASENDTQGYINSVQNAVATWRNSQ